MDQKVTIVMADLTEKQNRNIYLSHVFAAEDEDLNMFEPQECQLKAKPKEKNLVNHNPFNECNLANESFELSRRLLRKKMCGGCC